MYEFNRKVLKDFFNSIILFTNEAKLTFEDGVFSITELDPANVSLINRSLMIKSKKKSEILMNVRQLKESIDKISAEYVNISVKKDILEIIGDFEKITIKAIRDEKTEIKIPRFKYSSEAKVPTKLFYKMVEGAWKSAETIKFMVEKNNFVMRTKEEEGKIYESKIEECAKGKEIECLYSLEYLTKKFFKNSQKLRIRFSQDYPLRIEDEFGNFMILAPRVEER